MVICKLLEKEKGRMTAMCFTRNFVKKWFSHTVYNINFAAQVWKYQTIIYGTK
jgi:hypothetical protein